MTGEEMKRIREKIGLDYDDWALQLGYRGNTRNNEALMKRYENGSKQIPLTVASLAWLLGRWAHMMRLRGKRGLDQLPNWPEWEGYDDPIGPPIDFDRATCSKCGMPTFGIGFCANQPCPAGFKAFNDDRVTRTVADEESESP